MSFYSYTVEAVSDVDGNLSLSFPAMPEDVYLEVLQIDFAAAPAGGDVQLLLNDLVQRQLLELSGVTSDQYLRPRVPVHNNEGVVIAGVYSQLIRVVA